MQLYNAVMRLVYSLIRLTWTRRWLKRFVFSKHKKAFRLIMGQRDLLDRIRREVRTEGREVIWMHAASYGEYNVIRPVIRALKGKERCIVVTVFSPTGYRAVRQENARSHEADYLFYLPWDTRSNVRQFLDAITPSRAIFSVSEYWLNYLSELYRRHIPTYIVSMIVGDRSYLLKWYGRPIRKALRAVTTFMVLDEPSKDNLRKIGFANAEVLGDPLFDNAIRISQEPYHNAVVERFCQSGQEVFIAGSISDHNDLRLVAALAKSHADVKFILAPRETDRATLDSVQRAVGGKAVYYSDCTGTTDFTGTQVLIIDFMGALSRIYRYGRLAYVGGGFTKELHSVIEPVVYGVPVAFGPRISRKRTPQAIVRLGIGQIVRNEGDLAAWYDRMHESDRLAEVHTRALRYTAANARFTERVVETLNGGKDGKHEKNEGIKA